MAPKFGNNEISSDLVNTSACSRQPKVNVVARLQENISFYQHCRLQKKKIVAEVKKAEDLKALMAEHAVLSTKIRSLKGKPIVQDMVSNLFD